ncbi:DNA primase [Priestia taiwanensis]|uniref:DNA primase n=1 Tax=Priestia taiwanensis TaxID=1347902 RepID=A0A917ATL8_9BACI|nr:DNA primase [Priestia taiwanensis]MBM7363760.1 DNA primase [Priestia taiwanensis]GGE74372.1 DNA primase [Priestia taiwanensis]
MGNRIPDEIIEKVRHSTDIVEVVSEYVQLKKQGRNYFGLCPFHGESTPSFSVSPDKQIYHCFGCGAGGNSITFLTNIEGISFFDAVNKLGEKANISLKEYEPSSSSEPISTTTTSMIEAHTYLAKYYHHLLLNTEEGKEALQYLLDRGFTLEAIEKFGIGYSLERWDAVTNILQRRGYSLSLMEEAGLVIRREQDGNYFDRFRNRIMFPIHNLQGKVVAFSGRSLGEDTPKYLNSPETTIFTKGRILYNYHQSRAHMRKKQRAILLEGYADVIAAYKAGYEETIATMGTALTEEQAKTIRRTVDQVIISFDGDAAGISAAFKAANMLIQVGCEVKIAQLPEGLDPDDYVKKYGAEKFRTAIIEASLSFMAFKLYYLRQGKNLQDESVRMKYIHDVLQEVAKLNKPIEIEHYINTLSKDFSISVEALQAELSNIHRQTKPTEVVKVRRQTPSFSTKKTRLAYENAERILIAHMLQNADIARKVQEKLPGLFHIQEHSEIIIHLYAYYEEGNYPDVSNFLGRLPNASLQNLVTEIALINVNPDVSEQEIKDCIQAVIKHEREMLLKQRMMEVEEAIRQQDRERAKTLQYEIQQLLLTIKS